MKNWKIKKIQFYICATEEDEQRIIDAMSKSKKEMEKYAKNIL